jgi:hypothetical protein
MRGCEGFLANELAERCSGEPPDDSALEPSVWDYNLCKDRFSPVVDCRSKAWVEYVEF